MSINSIKRALRALPYTEMKAFAAQVCDGVVIKVDPDKFADVVSTLPLADEDSLKTEDLYLSRAFTKKRGGKCTLALKKVGGGWEVRTGDFTHTGATLRGAVSELLDQIAAYEALVPGEGRAL